MEDTGGGNRNKAGLAWGFGAALVGSLCCVGPVVALVMGLGSASFLLSFAAYRPFLLGGSALMMGAGALIMLRRSRTCCNVEQRGGSLLTYLAMAVATFALGYGLLTYVIPSLAYRPRGDSPTPISATEPAGQSLANPDGGVSSPRALRQAVLEISGMT